MGDPVGRGTSLGCRRSGVKAEGRRIPHRSRFSESLRNRGRTSQGQPNRKATGASRPSIFASGSHSSATAGRFLSRKHEIRRVLSCYTRRRRNRAPYKRPPSSDPRAGSPTLPSNIDGGAADRSRATVDLVQNYILLTILCTRSAPQVSVRPGAFIHPA